MKRLLFLVPSDLDCARANPMKFIMARARCTHVVGHTWNAVAQYPLNFECSVTGARYRDEVLDPYVRLSRGACDPDIILTDDNARQHTGRI
ncbi:hypothetical protein TNCV_139961 [Trichonephila clavipes]|uniref:Transposase n=1 Tax=Trichonephila clavipes TaxID=2585209 RepID=A0A8X6RI95_TRICX|nr:hypothetical protein TNCV_139961 [Trichonephila clavipes]